MLINFAPTLPDLQALEKLYLSLSLTSLLSKNPDENILVIVAVRIFISDPVCILCFMGCYRIPKHNFGCGKQLLFFNIPNMVIEAYCNKGDFENVAAYVDQVVEIMKKCVVAEDKRGCRLNNDTLEACVKYLKENGDLQMEEEIEKACGYKIRYQHTSATSFNLQQTYDS
uniref:Uncharacterized protein n=1 Tax=Tanacetum cinerariifolium TaxID=118510 RepID=A0A6L2P5G3_TANCI|nr:hypothetical protein [Tanacetum cinerariifolium]